MVIYFVDKKHSLVSHIIDLSSKKVNDFDDKNGSPVNKNDDMNGKMVIRNDGLVPSAHHFFFRFEVRFGATFPSGEGTFSAVSGGASPPTTRNPG